MASDAPFDPAVSEDVAAYLEGLVCVERPFETRIHPRDEMYCFELEAPNRSPGTAALRYFATASSIFRTVSEVVAWRFGAWGGVRSLLDFASGYGRATRFFAASIDPASITAADIDPGAVAFQVASLGVRGCVSGPDPEDFAAPGSDDVVLAASFFSHLPGARFEAWLARLYGRLAEGGVLLFSTHGPDLLPAPEALPPSGIAFRAESETTRLDGANYGTSWVSEAFVRSATERAGIRDGRLSAHPRGLCGHQDLYVLAKPPLPSRKLRLVRDPLGALEAASVGGGVVRARGWARGDRDERPPDVRLHLGDRLEAHEPGEGAPGAARDWSFEFPVSAVDPDRIVRIEAESPRGARRLLVAETLRPYLPVVRDPDATV